MVEDNLGRAVESHPVWVRGLKRILQLDYLDGSMSHPVWVRGLKLL